MRRAIAIAALLAAACGDEGATAPRSESPPPAAQPAAPAPPRQRAAEEPDDAATVAGAVADKTDATPAADGTEVTGSVVWADTGEPVESFEVGLSPPRISSSSVERDAISVAGEKGRFRVVLPEDGTWYVFRVIANGGPEVRCIVSVDAASGVAPALRVPRPGQATLRIVDGVTRAPLASARVIWANSPIDEPGEFETGHVVPGPQRHLRLWSLPARPDADGCVAFALGGRTGDFFVIADGYAWSAVRAGDGNGPTEVRLAPGGSLRLSIPRWNELEAATVDTNVGRPGCMELGPPREDGTLRVEGLLAGRHTITVRRGQWFESGVVYGSGDVEIVPGAEARLTIDADPGEQRGKVTVTGSVVVPGAWGDAPSNVTIEGAEPENADVTKYALLDKTSAGSATTFRLDEVPMGRYRLEIQPFQWRRQVVVGPGATHWTFDLGPPAEVVVKVVDDASRATAPDAEVTWHTSIEGLSGWGTQGASQRASDGAFVLLAPPGPVHVEASAPGHVPASQVVDAAAGTNSTVTLRLAAGASLVVRLECDGKAFTAAAPNVSVRQDDDENSYTEHCCQLREGTAQCDSLRPGKCIVSVPPDEIAGWTCAERTVELKAGETTTVVLEVKRKP